MFDNDGGNIEMNFQDIVKDDFESGKDSKVVDIKSKSNEDNTPYCVLARKYRPNDFDTLIGQDGLVRTLSNALKFGRIAQSFMLTGVRGVGKTTTARIIAKALNCSNTDKNGNPPVKPCGLCDNCVDIANGNHIDVVEMDAASNTGIDDIREIIESTQYTPTMGRYKIYILDEIHMLSKNAFNGLLKTLEEPPAHIKFIFATTEIGKVPVTILSRCQRFDLRRVQASDLYKHYLNIVNLEGFSAEEEAIRTIARCADGSVRDGLSMLDQALALSENKKITSELVNSMLGLADRNSLYELFEFLMAGDNVKALNKINELYNVGAEPIVILGELLDISWLLTRFKVNPSLIDDSTLPEIEKYMGGKMSPKLSVSVLTKSWQILNKGLGEMQVAQNQLMTLEMIAVRLMYASELSSPVDLVKKLDNSNSPVDLVKKLDNSNSPAHFVDGVENQTQNLQNNKTVQAVKNSDLKNTKLSDEKFDLQAEKIQDLIAPKTFVELIEFIQKKLPSIGFYFFKTAREVETKNQKFTINIKLEHSKRKKVYDLLQQSFGKTVKIEYTEIGGEQTLDEIEQYQNKQTIDKAEQTELVKSVKKYFPDAEIKKIDLMEND